MDTDMSKEGLVLMLAKKKTDRGDDEWAGAPSQPENFSHAPVVKSKRENLLARLPSVSAQRSVSSSSRANHVDLSVRWLNEGSLRRSYQP